MGEKAVITMFGPPRVFGSGGREVFFPTQRSRNLLMILALEHGRATPREQLFELLWPINPPARPKRALNNELWRLRQSLEAGGIDPQSLIGMEGGTIWFQKDQCVDVDVHQFDRAIEKAVQPGPAAKAAAREAERLYKGDLLTGIYDDWCLAPREAYRARFLDAVESLLNAFIAQRAWRDAIRTGRRILSEDPLLEHVHREIMRSYAHLGDRAAAARQFETLRKKLRRELDVAPSAETLALRDAILSDSPLTASGEARRLAAEKDVVRNVEALSTALNEAQRALQNLNKAIERSVK